MTFKLFPSHGMSVKMIGLLHIEVTLGIIVTLVAVTALEANERTLFSKMLPNSIVRVAIIWSTKALILWTAAVTWLCMFFKLSHSVDFKLLKSSATVSNFYFVNNVLQQFRLNILETFGVSALAKETDYSVPLLHIWLIVPTQTSVTYYFCTVLTLFGVYWNR